MRREAGLTVFRGQVTVVEPGGALAGSWAAGVEPDEASVSITPEDGAVVELAYGDIEDLFDDDHTLRLTDFTGRRYDLSMLGKAYGEVASKVARFRRGRLQRDLLLRGVGTPKAFPGTVFHGLRPETRAEVRLFDDLLIVMPERGLMWGLPYSFVDRVDWDEDRYQVHVTDDQGTVHSFGYLAKRSEEFLEDLRARLEALARRSARTLSALVPGLEPSALSGLASEMRDGRAVQQRAVDAVAPGAWPRLEDAVAGTGDRRASFQSLKAMTPPGWTALGVKATQAEPDADDAPQETAEGASNAAPATAAGTISWFFCPLAVDGRPVNAVAQEVTSEEGHATYVFRLMEPERFASCSGERLAGEVESAVARLNRALLTLNFRREPIYASQEDVEHGRFARYRVALRSLDYLRWARAAFLGRAIHTNETAWRSELDRAVARAG